MERKRYVQVGTGGRSGMYTRAILKEFRDSALLVGLCDSNPGRLSRAAAQAAEMGAPDIPCYTAADFDRMIEEQKPDCVVVTSMDSTHDYYIVRAMELGCDAITEKPMTIDERRCARILEAKRATGRRCTVTFNYRYSPPRTQIKHLLMSGVIGEIVSVDFHWLLDTHHGADYFRRWHRNKRNSGGLMVHKATHHFDLVNWWLSAVPTAVFARGSREFYKPETARRYGLTQRGERCHGCAESARCPFHLDITRGGLREMYFDCEQHDGYFRDRCVFSSLIDIEDVMHLAVKYDTGATMSYSLHAFSPWEGYIITFQGTRGRIEHKCEESVYINGDGSVPCALKKEGTWTRIYPHFDAAYSEEIWTGEGGHGGGDTLLLQDIFAPNPPEDPYKRAADERSGAFSILTGIAANRSMEWGRDVFVSELVPNIDRPDYAPMPDRWSDLPIPPVKK